MLAFPPALALILALSLALFLALHFEAGLAPTTRDFVVEGELVAKFLRTRVYTSVRAGPRSQRFDSIPIRAARVAIRFDSIRSLSAAQPIRFD